MAHGTITDRQAKAITSKALATGVTGLTLQPSGTKGRGKWILRYVSPVTRSRRQMSFGTYPDLSVAEALKRGREAREQLAAGADPLQARRQREAVPTFEQAARDRYAVLAPGFTSSRARNWIRSLEMYAFPALGHSKVDALMPQDFADMLEPIWLEKADTARRVKQRCHNVMAACWARGQIRGNPLDVVEMLLPKSKRPVHHHPAMPWQQVPAFVQAELSGDVPVGARAALLWAILTACRSNEVRGARWAEIDMQAHVWTVPAERMKAGIEHRVPLSPAALALLDALPRLDDDLVFPGARGGKMSDMALTQLLRKAKAPSDTPGRAATQHGFRSSFRNWAADHGYDTDVAERALAHTIGNKVRAAYERTDRLQARVSMMDAWGQHVMHGSPGNVVPMRGNARR